MQNDDSFNDSDEIFNLYSSKNIKETFKTQFQKLVASKPTVNKEQTKSFPTSKDQGKENEELEKNVSFETIPPSPILDDRCLEDSIEVLEHVTRETPTRRSQRLREKRQANDSLVCLDDGVVKKPNRRKGKKKNFKTRRKSAEVITLDSPDPAENLEEDELNPEISVKVIWKSVSIKKFQLRKFQKFAKIFEDLAREENIPEKKIILTFNNVKIGRNDTPDSLNLQLYHFIDGGVLSESTNCTLSNSTENNLDENVIVLKFQDVNKKIVKVSLNKNDKMKIGMIKYSEQMEVPLEKLKFYFDGELLSPVESPASLEMENNEIVDVKICN